MLADPLVLKDSAAADTSLALVSNVTDPKTGKVTSTRTNTTSPHSESEPLKLTINQSVTGSGAARVRRTQVLITDTHVNSTTGVPSTASYQGSWVFPLNGEFSTTDLDDLICLACDLFLSTGSLAVDATKRTALLQGQA